MKNFQEQCRQVFSDIDKHIEVVTEETMKAVAKETAAKIRSEVRVKKGLHKTGKYASGWRVKSIKKAGQLTGFQVYNSAAPGLTHLLEKGHVVKNQHGTYGRVNGIPHIKPAEKWAEQIVMRQLLQKI